MLQASNGERQADQNRNMQETSVNRQQEALTEPKRSSYSNQAMLRRSRAGVVSPQAPLRPSQGLILQRKCTFGAPTSPLTGEREEFTGNLHLQAKLTIGASNDALEQEADRVADQVMRMPDPELSVSSIPPRISRKCAACEEEEAKMLQTKPTTNTEAAVGEAPTIVHEVLRSTGQPLDPDVREFMGTRFGFDFSRVRIHTNTLAAESALVVGARAYTVGTDIVFGPSAFAPTTNGGRWLIAHELAHVIQQTDIANPTSADSTQIQRTPEENAPSSDGEASSTSASSQVKDTSKLMPSMEIDIAEGRAFALAAIAAMSPYGAKISPPPNDAVASIDGNQADTVAENDTATSEAETLQTSVLRPMLQRSGAGSVKPEAGVVGSIQLCFDVCTGEISVVGWIWAGGGIVGKGLFGGRSWWRAYVFAEGNILKPKKLDFIPTLNCGTCDPACKPDDTHIDWGAGFGGFPIVLEPGKRASLKKAGIEAGFLLTLDSLCTADVELIALVDLTKYLGPLGVAVTSAEELANKLGKKFGIEIECGIGVDVSGIIHLCKSVPGGGLLGITSDSARACGGGYVGCGIGLEHDKAALPGI